MTTEDQDSAPQEQSVQTPKFAQQSVRVQVTQPTIPPMASLPATNNVVNVKAQSGRSRVEQELMTLFDLLTPEASISGRNQYSLLTLMRSILETQDQVMFEKEWGVLLSFFQRSKNTLFDIGHMLRFGEGWPGSESEFSLYRRLFWLCSETSDPRTRKTVARKMINMTKVVEGLSDQASNRLIGYYD